MRECYSFFTEYRGSGPVYHGAVDCYCDPDETFRCSECKRIICYCGGHGDEHCDSCPRCDECCDGPEEATPPRLAVKALCKRDTTAAIEAALTAAEAAGYRRGLERAAKFCTENAAPSERLIAMSFAKGIRAIAERDCAKGPG